jgi:FdhD protein
MMRDGAGASSPPRPGSTTRAGILSVDNGRARRTSDLLATEEPMEIRLLSGGQSRTVAITMRTPGADFELAAGFLHGEQIVRQADDIRRISYCTDPSIDSDQRYNVVSVELRSGLNPDLKPLDRNFYTTSACGVCGKASLDALRIGGCASVGLGPSVTAATVSSLAERLKSAQGLFASTGGLHAAALFEPSGTLIGVREDVGRHNAVDKLLGWAFLQGQMPLSATLLLVSGRASYEIMQKAAVAGIPIVCAISAPSSLALALARDFGMTLIGFLRGARFNIYSGAERIADATKPR